MNLLYVGHTYTVRANHAKIAALARASSSSILLMTPHAWKGPLYSNNADSFASSEPTVRHEIVHAFGIGKEGAYLFAPRIVSLIREFRPDIVHVEQGAYALVYSQILLVLQAVAPQARATFFTWWNLPYEPKRLKGASEAFNLRHSSCAFAGNEDASRILQEHGFTRPVYVLPQLGIESPSKRRKVQDAERFKVGYVGRIAAEKGVLDLVGAVARMKSRDDVELLFVGNGDAVAEVEALAGRTSVRLTHMPAVRNEEVPALLATLDVLVLPSRSTSTWVEQFGHILLEAMAAGVPVIGSSSGEIPNVIGDAGIIFPEGDEAALARALESLRSNRELRQSLIVQAYDRIDSRFTHDVIAKRQLAVYDWMMREGKTVGELAAEGSTTRPGVHSAGGIA